MHFVDEGVMHVAGQHHIVSRRSRVAKDVHHHVGGAAMGHPVLRIDQQRLAGPAEHALHRLDQLDAEHRCRRDDQYRWFVENVLLEFAQRLPVHQAGRSTEVALAAPAPGVEHHQRRIGRQLVAPAVKPEQRIDQQILRRAIQPAIARRRQQLTHRQQQLGETRRIVAPGLTQQIGEQRVADYAPRQRMAVGGLFPARGEVPVIGDVVVIEDHQRRHMSQGAGDLRQPMDEALQTAFFAAIALGMGRFERGY